MHSVCILIYVSMYLCIYIATYLHMVYLDWQHTVIVSNSRCAWRWRQICTPCRSVHLCYPCISVHRPSLINDVLGGRDRASLEMQLQTEIEWTQGCTGRLWSTVFGDALWCHDQLNLEMHSEAVIELVWRCTWRRRSSELRAALGGRDRASLEMQLETEIEWTQRCTGRLRSSEFGHALGGRDWVNSEMHSELWSSEFWDALAAGYDRGRLEENLEVVDLEAVDGRRARCPDSIHRLVNSKPWESALMELWEWRDDRQSEVYAVLGVCCTRRMLHSVLTHNDGMER